MMRYCPICKIKTKHLRCPLCGSETDDDPDDDPEVSRDPGYSIFDHAQYPEPDGKIESP